MKRSDTKAPDRTSDQRGRRRLAERLTLHAISGSSADNRDRVLASALERVVDLLLGSSSADSARWPTVGPEILEQLGEIEPEQVGELYEYLRGFRLGADSSGEPRLEPSAKGRRNQGLFYTPHLIVSHIVQCTLDALDLSRPEQYLNQKICDPAMGTGIFLAEALEQLTARSREVADEDPPDHFTQKDRSRSKEPMHLGGCGGVEDSVALDDVRSYLLTRCLYGIDLDPVAVKIGRAVLLHRAHCRDSSRPGNLPQVRHGNALMGTGRADPDGLSRESADRFHAQAYLGKALQPGAAHRLPKPGPFFHWPLEFPEVFSAPRSGFDAVIGNPPYEVVSVKESGIEERRGEQAYYRAIHSTCRGKINLYRLMVERGLDLLRDGGVLGFIVPATLLSDSTARALRDLILDRSQVLHAVVVPEKARVFEGVAQAYLILVARKGKGSQSVRPVVWDGNGPIPRHGGFDIERSLIRRLNSRIPVLRSKEEKAVLQAMEEHPPLGGDAAHHAIAEVHQGEINLSTRRQFITSEKTRFPLIRGEHIRPFAVAHPSSREGRLDYVLPQFVEQYERSVTRGVGRSGHGKRGSGARLGGRPWESPRIGLGRVVNMDTAQRLKAAVVPAGCFLGDMTNSMVKIRTSFPYLLGLLNSALLNWRIKLTSTNNYLSAAEVLALPIVRPCESRLSAASQARFRATVNGFGGTFPTTLRQGIQRIGQLLKPVPRNEQHAFLGATLERLAESLICPDFAGHTPDPGSWCLLNATVLYLYGVESYAEVLGTERFPKN